MEAVRDGFVPGSFTQLRALAAVGLGALLALALARVLARRSPGTAAGAGLVLLLVALVQPLADAADLLTSLRAPSPLLVAPALLVGLGAGALLPRGRARPGLLVVAVVLTALPALAPALDRGTIDFVQASPPQYLFDLRTLLLGTLLGGAVAAVRPGTAVALLGVLGLLVVFAASPVFAPPLLHAVAAGLALSLLLPVLVRGRHDEAGHDDAGRDDAADHGHDARHDGHDDAGLRRGLLVGLVLVGLVTAGRGALTREIDETLFGPGGRETAEQRQQEEPG